MELEVVPGILIKSAKEKPDNRDIARMVVLSLDDIIRAAARLRPVAK